MCDTTLQGLPSIVAGKCGEKRGGGCRGTHGRNLDCINSAWLSCAKQFKIGAKNRGTAEEAPREGHARQPGNLLAVGLSVFGSTTYPESRPMALVSGSRMGTDPRAIFSRNGARKNKTEVGYRGGLRQGPRILGKTRSADWTGIRRGKSRVDIVMAIQIGEANQDKKNNSTCAALSPAKKALGVAPPVQRKDTGKRRVKKARSREALHPIFENVVVSGKPFSPVRSDTNELVGSGCRTRTAEARTIRRRGKTHLSPAQSNTLSDSTKNGTHYRWQRCGQTRRMPCVALRSKTRRRGTGTDTFAQLSGKAGP